jgi:predicted nucleotide-binding protein
MLVGASSAYGMTTGAWDSDTIAPTELGKRIAAGSGPNYVAALKQAVLRPRVIGAFLKKYSGNRLPNAAVAAHVLTELGIPEDSTTAAYEVLVKSAHAAGLLHDNKGNQYVDLDGVPEVKLVSVGEDDGGDDGDGDELCVGENATEGPPVPKLLVTSSAPANNRVFITHGKNMAVVNQLKELLSYGGMTPVVVVEHETISKPLPDKVMDDMRSCVAAIIHVGKEIKVTDKEDKEHIFINQNVLIEIGAAMALYGRKFILLVERGSVLPSNLLGLYECRYEGEKLDYDATMKLLKAFNEFRQ